MDKEKEKKVLTCSVSAECRAKCQRIADAPEFHCRGNMSEVVEWAISELWDSIKKGKKG